MSHPYLYAQSVGGLTKKIMEINPDLNVHEIIAIIKKATLVQHGVQTVDEPLVIELAQRSKQKTELAV